MSQKAKAVAGCAYLYQRGGRYIVRVQIPQELRAVLGKSEFKKSVGGDLALAKRRYHSLVSQFLAEIDGARRGIVQPGARLGLTGGQPTAGDIEAACYAHFKRMALNMRGKVSEPVGDDPSALSNRVEGFRLMIENQIAAHAHDAWNSMSIEAQWLCDEHGWNIAPEGALFEHLCRTMLRARLQCYRDELRRLEGKFSPDPEVDPLFGNRPPEPKAPSITLGTLMDKFNASREAKWSASTRRNYIIINRVIEEVCGRGTPLEQIDYEFCDQLRSTLLRLPANYQKHPSLTGKPIPEVIKIAEAKGLPLIGPATINGHLNKLAAIIRFGRDRGWIAGNPMSGIEVPDPIHPSDKRAPFTTAQLNLLFATDPWQQPFDPDDPNPSRYWAPLIGLYSGARLTDICGQLVEEMVEIDGVRLFDFVHRPGERHIKGGRSRRVPVHPDLAALGFWDFVEAARQSGRRQLFPDVKRDQVGKWGDNTSKWFSRKVAALQLKGRRLSFHSFRHTFEDALRRVDLHDTPLGNAITGRSTAGVSKNYGSKYPVEKLRDAINLIGYPGMTLNIPGG